MNSDEIFFEAVNELKRAHQSVFVSLKYTRTVDVLRAILKRLESSIELAFDALLEKAREDKKIAVFPKLPKQKTELIRELYPDELIQQFIDFYFALRKILRAKYEKIREYRRHLAMRVEFENKKIDITIDIITDYYNKTKEFFEHISDLDERWESIWRQFLTQYI